MNTNKDIGDVVQDKDHFRVSIFGSARTKPGDPEYDMVYNLAYQLGKEEIGVITGGGPGQMEAGNKGFTDAESKEVKSIGLTIRLPFEAESNDYVDIEEHFNVFSNRLDHFMAMSNVVVVTAGGIGTALELFYTLQLTQVKHICPIPIILADPMWHEIKNWMETTAVGRGFISPKDLSNIFVVDNEAQAMDLIRQAKRAFDSSEGSMCLNSQVYHLMHTGARNRK